MITDRKICYFEMNVLRWFPFVHLFDTPFQNSPYGHANENDCIYQRSQVIFSYRTI